MKKTPDNIDVFLFLKISVVVFFLMKALFKGKNKPNKKKVGRGMIFSDVIKHSLSC